MADNLAQEAKKKEKTRTANNQIKNIANLEDEMAKKDAGADGAHPRSRNGKFTPVPCPDANNLKKNLTVSDDGQDAPPKPKKKAKVAERPPGLRPVAKTSQPKAKLPDIESDKHDLATSSAQKSKKIGKFLLLTSAVLC